MRTQLKPIPTFFSISKILVLFALLFALPAMAQKNKHKNDSLARRDSIREFMFQASLYSLDAIQARFESQKATVQSVKQRKAGESENLFFQSRKYYRFAIVCDSNYYPAWCNMGTTYYMQDLPKMAIPCYRKALSINPNYAQAWYNLGQAFDMQHLKDSAIRAYTQCVRSDSTYLQAYLELSGLAMENGKDTSAAFNYLRLAAKYKSISEVPWVSMAAIYFSYNDSANAIACLDKAEQTFPGNIDRLQNLVNYYRFHNFPEKADQYSKLLAIEKKKQEITRPPDGGK